MNSSENIICFSSIDWDFIWQGHQQIMQTFANQGHRVLFIENTGVRSPGIKDISRIKKR
ncbi:MAG: Glycosyltransferase, partial [Candidatus Nomurabacteria bacterium GW2011_GWA2_40_9]